MNMLIERPWNPRRLLIREPRHLGPGEQPHAAEHSIPGQVVRRAIQSGAVINAFLACCLAINVTEVVEGAQPVPMFDGKSFAGWEGNLESFRIQDRAVVAGNLSTSIPRNEFLCTQRRYADFELTLKVKVLGDGANAGIQFRSERIPDHHEVRGYQADIGKGWWGKLYDESRRSRVLAPPANAEGYSKHVKPNGWNDYRIRCQGRRIQLWLNGYPTVDFYEDDETIPREGIIGLQIHAGPPCEAWYKEIRIVELDANAGVTKREESK